LIQIFPDKEINFGYGYPSKTLVSKELYMTNNSPKYIYISFLIPGINCPLEEGYKHSFKVTPIATFIKPYTKFTFNIQFDPDDICKIYKHELVYRYRFTNYGYITNKIFNEIDFISVSKTISVSGHSFPKGYELFIPLMEVFPSKNIHFKPCRIHETVYQTVVLLNSGDTPIHYDFIHIPSCFNT